jgi:hypothetical protein
LDGVLKEDQRGRREEKRREEKGREGKRREEEGREGVKRGEARRSNGGSEWRSGVTNMEKYARVTFDHFWKVDTIVGTCKAPSYSCNCIVLGEPTEREKREGGRGRGGGKEEEERGRKKKRREEKRKEKEEREREERREGRKSWDTKRDQRRSFQ